MSNPLTDPDECAFPESDQISTDNLTTIIRNWNQASRELDELVRLHEVHRASGCNRLFCSAMPGLLAIRAQPPHAVIQLLSVAMERLAKQGSA